MGDEKKKKVKDDPKWEFVSNYVSRSMNLKGDRFSKMMNEEVKVSPFVLYSYNLIICIQKSIIFDLKIYFYFQELFQEYFKNTDIRLLVITTNASGALIPSYTFPQYPKGKSCYFLKNSRHTLTLDNLHEVCFILI